MRTEPVSQRTRVIRCGSHGHLHCGPSVSFRARPPFRPSCTTTKPSLPAGPTAPNFRVSPTRTPSKSWCAATRAYFGAFGASTSAGIAESSIAAARQAASSFSTPANVQSHGTKPIFRAGEDSAMRQSRFAASANCGSANCAFRSCPSPCHSARVRPPNAFVATPFTPQ